MYEPFYTTKPVKAGKGDDYYDSWDQVEWWRAMSIAHKYSMTRLLQSWRRPWQGRWRPSGRSSAKTTQHLRATVGHATGSRSTP